MKSITLLTYDKKRVTVALKPIEIKKVDIKVLSGDEIAIIKYADGSVETYDSSELSGNKRVLDTFSGYYTLYDSESDIDNIKLFNTRNSSYELINKCSLKLI